MGRHHRGRESGRGCEERAQGGTRPTSDLFGGQLRPTRPRRPRPRRAPRCRWPGGRRSGQPGRARPVLAAGVRAAWRAGDPLPRPPARRTAAHRRRTRRARCAAGRRPPTRCGSSARRRRSGPRSVRRPPARRTRPPPGRGSLDQGRNSSWTRSPCSAARRHRAAKLSEASSSDHGPPNTSTALSERAPRASATAKSSASPKEKIRSLSYSGAMCTSAAPGSHHQAGSSSATVSPWSSRMVRRSRSLSPSLRASW